MNEDELQVFQPDVLPESELRFRYELNRLCLQEISNESKRNAGIGIRQEGFHPAFLNQRNGHCCLSRYADGRTAPIHVWDGLPDSWIAERADDGQVLRVSLQVVSGYLCNGLFYTREKVFIPVHSDSDS